MITVPWWIIPLSIGFLFGIKAFAISFLDKKYRPITGFVVAGCLGIVIASILQFDYQLMTITIMLEAIAGAFLFDWPLSGNKYAKACAAVVGIGLLYVLLLIGSG